MSEDVQKIISTLKIGQEKLHLEIEKSIHSDPDASEDFKLYYFFIAIAENPDRVQWPSLMENIEKILSEFTPEEAALVEQYILEGLSNYIANGVLDSKPIVASIGPKARSYIGKYDKAMGSKTPGF